MHRFLEKYGYSHALEFLDEWNYMIPEPNTWDGMFCRISKKERRFAFEQQKLMPGCSFAVSTMIQMQNSPIDMAVYYDAQPHMLFCGLFDAYGVEQKTFYGFKAFNYLYRAGTQVDLTCDDGNIYALAATDSKKNYVLLSNHEGEDTVADIIMEHLKPDSMCRLYLLDDTHDLELCSTDYFVGEKVMKRVPMKRNTVVLLELYAAQ